MRKRKSKQARGKGANKDGIAYIWLSNKHFRKCILLLILCVGCFSQLHLLNRLISSTDEVVPSNLPPQNDETRITNKKTWKHRNCPFRDSPIVESIYVYPVPGDTEWKGDILSNYTRTSTNIKSYPWIENDLYCKEKQIGPYDIQSQMVQYNTELMVREIITNPESCLRTYDPEKATLFYVPYLPAAEFHNGSLYNTATSKSKYGDALIEAITKNNLEPFEREFGWTSKYWKKNNGSDHILVFSEPMHGLWHPRSRRGNYHFLHSQYQTYAPIVISVELSTTFIDMYPYCARKNILMPYPNTNGMWYNGKYDKAAIAHMVNSGIRNTSDSSAAMESEKKLHAEEIRRSNLNHNNSSITTTPPRVLGYYYSGGSHGTCTHMRKSMKNDFDCSPSGQFIKQSKLNINYVNGYRQATFCPAPGGDSPSAKRNFDVLLAGCVPVVLSKDYVWPFTTEFDRSDTIGDASNNVNVNGITPNTQRSTTSLNPKDFSIRLQSVDHQDPKYDPKTCQLLQKVNSTEPHQLRSNNDLQSILEAVSPEELKHLRRGVAHASYTYSYYKKRPDFPDNPLLEGVLPDGGAAHMLVKLLSERKSGALWSACENELKEKDISKDTIRSFQC